MQSKEKYSQLIQDGFCIVPRVLAPELLKRLKIVTDRLCSADDMKARRRFRSQGSMLSTMCDPIFAELIAWPTSLSLFTQMGFDTPPFTDGYIISKPPHSPPFFGITTGLLGMIPLHMIGILNKCFSCII